MCLCLEAGFTSLVNLKAVQIKFWDVRGNSSVYIPFYLLRLTTVNFLTANFKIIKYHFHFSLWFKTEEDAEHSVNKVMSVPFHYFLRMFQWKFLLPEPLGE